MNLSGAASKKSPPPVFVLAAPRSFSSLVNAMIGQHPELFGLPELNLFQCETVAEYNARGKTSGGPMQVVWSSMRHGLLRTIAQVYSGEQTIESVRMAERWLRVRQDRTTTDVFHELATEIAPLRMVEKSPAVIRKSEFMMRMLNAFPDAKFIHLVRHPVAQCNSALNSRGGIGILLAVNSVDYRGEFPAIEPQIAWHDAQIQILRFTDLLAEDQFITVRGEEFLSNLDETLPALCRWLEIDDGPEAIAAMRRPEDSPFSCLGPPNAKLGNDVNFLNAPKLREGNVKVPAFEAELSWRTDGEGLHPDVTALAQALGY
ncbi:MAG: sulfotransferase [Pseudomonadota bacterium]